LYLNGALGESDHVELLAICKGAAPGFPLEAAHLKDPSAGGAVVNLRQLHGLTNVNALAEGERLVFSKSGLTVVYGDNGAGKSGYARVLKQLCRARTSKGDTILSNVYALKGGTPSAQIDFNVGGQNQSAQWSLGQQPDPRLSAVSVFDSSTANVHVDSTNNLAYTPVPLKMLASLADACKELKSRLGNEVLVIQSKVPAALAAPACSALTKVGRLVSSLSSKTKPELVEAESGLSDAQGIRLEELQQDLNSDPARLSRQLTVQKTRIEADVSKLEAMVVAGAISEANSLWSLKEALLTAQVAAVAASKDLFSDEPLPDIGSAAWRALWSAAREYSKLSAYKGKTFPVVEDGAVCPLCQQVLDDEAIRRLESFELFVKDESKRQEAVAKAAYDGALGKITGAIPDIRTIPALVAWYRDDIGQPELAATVRTAMVKIAWRLRAIARLSHPDNLNTLPAVPDLPLTQLRNLADSISQRASALLAENNSPERMALVSERDELLDRKWLATMKEDVLLQIGRLKEIEAIGGFVKGTHANRITALSTDIARTHVTSHLKTCFTTEVEKLGVSNLAIELQQAKSSAGVPQFQIRLTGMPDQPVGKILSEGEHRCIALAAFLAELATTDSHSAIVFDDPVSSLDHMHRQSVAARLAEEASRRQVIVFTHDMAFLLLIDEECRGKEGASDTPVLYRLISRGPTASGFCNEDPPTDVMPLDKVIEAMRRHLGNVEIHHARGDQARWQNEVKSFQVSLRTSWERAVEEVVRPVIKRLARKVDTTGLLKLTVLTEDDCRVMRDAFRRCSALLHSQPGELRASLPSAEAIQSEIDALASWIEGIRLKQERV
jgi:energy-coupling factor transporter ATP-binding protein EcfA2